jgi:hypothetical protein
MIEYAASAAPPVRCGETEIAGRRVAALGVPYGGESGAAGFRFDPLERRLIERRSSGRVAVGPADPDLWERAFARCAAGPVLVGPGSSVEAIRGAGLAAAEGARRAGRGVYLLDPDPAGMPEGPPSGFVVLVSWAPLGGFGERERFEAARAHGFAAGGLLPIVPGWTDDPGFVDGYLSRLATTGGRFAAAIPYSGDGEARRLLVEARERAEPAEADRFFETVHHGDWTTALREASTRFRRGTARHGLAGLPPRPRGPGESPSNSAAAALLEQRAAEREDDEHRAALLLAAARWIDESGRDLAAVVREGNFGKIFPFGALAAEAEAAFRTGPGP